MLAAFALTFIFTALVLAPLVPALTEWRLRRDVTPLRVERKHDGNIRYFAAQFRETSEALLGGPLPGVLTALCESPGFAQPAGYCLIGASGHPSFDVEASKFGRCDSTLLCAAPLTLPERFAFSAEVYGATDVSGGQGSVFRALLAEGDLRLAADATVVRWAHATRVFVDCGGKLLGRVSADRLLRIEGPCRFVRLSAPRIEFGESDAVEIDLQSRDFRHAPDPSAEGTKRTLIETDAEVPAGGLFEGDLVAYGNVVLGRGALVAGSVKSHGDTMVEENVVVEGALVSTRTLTLGPGSRARGPLVAEREIVIGAGCVIGAEGIPTSLTAPHIVIHAGAVVFGTVWAREGGELVA